MSGVKTYDINALSALAKTLGDGWEKSIISVQSMQPPAKATIQDKDGSERSTIMISPSPGDSSEFIIDCECGHENCYHLAVFWRMLTEAANKRRKASANEPIETELVKETVKTPEELDLERGPGDSPKKPVKTELVKETEVIDDNHPVELTHVPAVASSTPRGIAPNSLKVLRLVEPPGVLMEAHKELVAYITAALEKDRDYGVIPGTGDKPVLLKPGAERLNLAHGVVAEFFVEEENIDPERKLFYTKWTTLPKPDKATETEMKAAGTGRNRKFSNEWVWQQAVKMPTLGFYRYRMGCILTHRETGAIVGTGVGSCSSIEGRFASRPNDIENTILKIAKKRCYVDATLTAYALSDRFTQDLDSMTRD